jgi:tRNA-guanine family transglycosylase
LHLIGIHCSYHHKADALIQLEKFFYKGLVHKGVKLPAVINFDGYAIGGLSVGEPKEEMMKVLDFQ